MADWNPIQSNSNCQNRPRITKGGEESDPATAILHSQPTVCHWTMKLSWHCRGCDGGFSRAKLLFDNMSRKPAHDKRTIPRKEQTLSVVLEGYWISEGRLLWGPVLFWSRRVIRINKFVSLTWERWRIIEGKWNAITGITNGYWGKSSDREGGGGFLCPLFPISPTYTHKGWPISQRAPISRQLCCLCYVSTYPITGWWYGKNVMQGGNINRFIRDQKRVRWKERTGAVKLYIAIHV